MATIRVVRFSMNIQADLERGWSAWMGMRSTSKDSAVLFAWESQGHGGERELDDCYQDAPEADWDSFIDRMADELDVRFDSNSSEWCVVHHNGLSCYVVNDGTYSADEEADAISRYATGTPTGEGHYTVGAVKLIETLPGDWHLLECQSYGIE